MYNEYVIRKLKDGGFWQKMIGNKDGERSWDKFKDKFKSMFTGGESGSEDGDNEGDEGGGKWTDGLLNVATTAIGSLDKSLVGNEYTGKTAEISGKIADQVTSHFSTPLGKLANTAGSTVGHLIGGTKDRVEGTGSAAVHAASAALSNFGPIGTVAGAALEMINGIGGKRNSTLDDYTSDIADDYGAGKMKVSNAIGQYSNKKAGLSDFGFHDKGERALEDARIKQRKMWTNSEYNKKRLNSDQGELLEARNQLKLTGANDVFQLSGKHGMKFPELDYARKILSLQSTKQVKEFKEGGVIGSDKNFIPGGHLHKNLHHITDNNPDLEGKITKKGIPVVAMDEGGEVTQVAEVETGEYTMSLTSTKTVEKFYNQYKANPSDDILIQCGKFLVDEILKNTDDKTGLIKSIK